MGVAYPDWLRADIQNSPLSENTRQIASRLRISQSTVVRVLNSDLTSRSKAGPRLQECTLTEADAAFLCVLKCEYPQASLSECRLALEIERGKVVSDSTISRELQRLGMTRKKMQRYSTRRSEDLRVRWWTKPAHLGGCSGVEWSTMVALMSLPFIMETHSESTATLL